MKEEPQTLWMDFIRKEKTYAKYYDKFVVLLGTDIKALQYVMGHSDVGVTLNVYTHANFDRAAEQMAKIRNFLCFLYGFTNDLPIFPESRTCESYG